MKIYLASPIKVKECKIGFSWTMLFFGVFVPLVRKDWKWFFLSLLLAVCTVGISWLVMPFLYNKIYIKGLLKKGYAPNTGTDANILRTKGYLAPYENKSGNDENKAV